MNFATKIFAASLMIALLSCALISISIYNLLKNDIKIEFINRYKTDQNIISNTFHQLELESDNTNKNAVMMLSEIVKIHGIPKNKELDNLAKKLGVNGFYVINSHGKFLRSSDLPIKLQHNSLFSYDPSYKNLIFGTLDIAITPIIPSYPYDIPAKLTMIPNHNRTLILESSTHLEYIEKILHQVIAADKNILSIGLYTPTGYELGSISSDGQFHQGRRDVNNKFFSDTKISSDSLTISTKIPSNSKNCLECINKDVSMDGRYYYILIFKVSLVSLVDRISALKKQVILIFMFMLILSGIISIIISRKLVSRVKEINSTVNNIIESKNLESQVNISGNDEISKLAIAFNKMTLALKESQNELIATEKARSIGVIANQVAHDIRSPLAALSILTNYDLPITGQSKILIRNVVNRIRDIANDLVEKSRDPNKVEISTDDHSVQLLTSIIFQIITEKRLQLCSSSQTIIEFELSTDNYGLFAKINLIEFKRMLSNLIDNSIEAIRDYGNIIIKLSHENENIQLIISDNGKGIPEDILKKVGSYGVSYGKKDGSGLGIYHAKNTINALDGSLNIYSKVGKGTDIVIVMPKAASPRWFLPKLRLIPQLTVIIVDDDLSILDLWRERLSNFGDITVITFSSPETFQSWQDEIKDKTNLILYLFDLEFLGFSQTGLDLIKNNQLQNKSILVTSHFEEKNIRECCVKLGIKMIPKDLIVFIPIVIVNNSYLQTADLSLLG